MNCKGTAINLCVDGGTGFSLILSQCLVFGQVKRLWENFLLFFTKNYCHLEEDGIHVTHET